DDATSCCVDQIAGWLHPPQSSRVEHPDRFRRLRTVKADNIGPRQRRIEIAYGLATRSFDLLGRLVGIVDEDIHLHCETAPGGSGAETSKADNEERLAEQIVGQLAKTRSPFALPDQRVHLIGALG